MFEDLKEILAPSNHDPLAIFIWGATAMVGVLGGFTAYGVYDSLENPSQSTQSAHEVIHHDVAKRASRLVLNGHTGKLEYHISVSEIGNKR